MSDETATFDDIIIAALAFEPDFTRAMAIEAENARRMNAALPAGIPKRATDNAAIKRTLIGAVTILSDQNGTSLTRAAQDVYAHIIARGTVDPTPAHIATYVRKFSKAAPR